MKLTLRVLATAAVVLVTACVGEGVDFDTTRSNCPWQSDYDFASAGYQLYHRSPRLCPLDIVVSSPWWPSWEYYLATVTAPVGTATTLSASIFDANSSPHEDFINFFYNYESYDRADVDGNYYAGRVPVEVNEQRADYAVNYTNTSRGYNATVDLTYVGTTVIIIANRTVIAGEAFSMDAVEQGSTRVPPFQYQWYRDQEPLGSPTTRNRLTTTLFEIGSTVTFRVEVTDANGLMTIAKHTVDVVESCSSPHCPVDPY